jgi:hypothetical protein
MHSVFHGELRASQMRSCSYGRCFDLMKTVSHRDTYESVFRHLQKADVLSIYKARYRELFHDLNMVISNADDTSSDVTLESIGHLITSATYHIGKYEMVQTLVMQRLQEGEEGNWRGLTKVRGGKWRECSCVIDSGPPLGVSSQRL